jgi:hypothetical protein
MAKTKLTLSDRMAIGVILPEEGKFEDLIVVEDIKDKVSIQQKELTDYEIQTLANGAVAWSAEKTAGVTFPYEFTDKEKEVIKESLKKLNDSEKLHASHVTLYKTFVK